MDTADPPNSARLTNLLERTAVVLFVPVLAGWAIRLSTGGLTAFWGTAWHITATVFWFVVLGCLVDGGVRTVAGEWRNAGWRRATATQWVGRAGLIFMTLLYVGNSEEYPSAAWTLAHRIAIGCFLTCFAAYVALRFLRPMARPGSGGDNRTVDNTDTASNS